MGFDPLPFDGGSSLYPIANSARPQTMHVAFEASRVETVTIPPLMSRYRQGDILSSNNGTPPLRSRRPILPAYRLAYVLATAYHETGRFKWLREIWRPTAAQKRYEGRADLGNTVKGDGKRFMGRGLIHITDRRNYADWSQRLGVDLIGHPELAEQLDHASCILVEGMVKGTFTGKKLQDFINSDQRDFLAARRIVNGNDKAALIAGYAEKFAAALESLERSMVRSGVRCKPWPRPLRPTMPPPNQLSTRGAI